MKILKFNESDNLSELSNDKVAEIIEHVSNFISDFNDKISLIEELSNDINSFKSQSKNSNDQIDNTKINLDILKSKLEDLIQISDNISIDLKDYNDNGRQYLY